jgi:hypothetical protein
MDIETVAAINEFDDKDGESSGEEPKAFEDDVARIRELPKGQELVGCEVFLDNKPGTVLKYVKDKKQYRVKFANKVVEKNVMYSAMSSNKDGWIGDSSSLSNNPNHSFEEVARDYDRVKIPNADQKDALDFFFAFFSLKFWKRICKETMNYGQKINAGFTLHINELLRWIALVIIWGIYHHFPSPSKFWASHWVFDSQQVARIMTSSRFKEIGRFLHLCDNGKDDKKDPFFKVRTMSDELNLNSVANYAPHREVSFDEMSPGSQHRTHLVVRTKHKKVPSAFDVKALCDGHNHYLIQHRLSAHPAPDIAGQTKTAGQVIAVLKAAQLQPYSKIYFDNLYATVALFSYLFVNFKCYAVGTWRSNFGVPNDLKREKVAPKFVDEEKRKILTMVRNTETKRPIMFGVAIYDSKPFYMLSTIIYPLKIVVGGAKKVSKFDIQHDYNKYMSGVDLNDQLQISYNTYITSMKWWKRLFFFYFGSGYYQRLSPQENCISRINASSISIGPSDEVN